MFSKIDLHVFTSKFNDLHDIYFQQHAKNCSLEVDGSF